MEANAASLRYLQKGCEKSKISPHYALHSLCVQNHLLEVDGKKAPAVGWDTIKYMVAVVQYGGRITDEYDKLLMDTLAEKYFQQVPTHCFIKLAQVWLHTLSQLQISAHAFKLSF